MDTVESNVLSAFKTSVVACLSLAGIENVDRSVVKMLEYGKYDFTLHDRFQEKFRMENIHYEEDSECLLKNIEFKNHQLFITLNRPFAFSKCLKIVHTLSSNYGSSRTFITKTLCFSHGIPESSDDLTYHRVKLIRDIAENLSVAVGFTVLQKQDNDCHAQLYCTHKSNLHDIGKHYKIILCGVVQNPSLKNKESIVTVSELKEKKKGILMSKTHDRLTFVDKNVDKLTDAILTYDLLRVKINSPVMVNYENDTDDSNSGTAIFILYNYCRLNVIIHEFESRVQQNYYPSLPDIESVDFNLLKEEKEWVLLKFVINFPNIVLSTVQHIEEGKVAPHMLCNFLHALARVLSSYYRSIKILLDDKSHLYPLIFARIYLMKAVHQVLHNGLNLLNIQPIPAL